MKSTAPSIKKKSLSRGLLFSLLLVCASAKAGSFETWKEITQCGNVEYTLESVCAKADEELTLNECKSQSLTVFRGDKARQVKLPDFTKSTINAIKKSRRTVSGLFVTAWACAKVNGENMQILYYSIGGGSAPFSEVWMTYDANGVLMDDEDPRSSRVAEFPFEKMKPVRSIMPE